MHNTYVMHTIDFNDLIFLQISKIFRVPVELIFIVANGSKYD